MIYKSHASIHTIEEFEKITLWWSSDESWCFKEWKAKTDEAWSSGRWLEKILQLKDAPIARFIHLPLLCKLWTVQILGAFGMDLSKQFLNESCGAWIQWTRASLMKKSTRIDEKSVMKFWRIWENWREKQLGSWRIKCGYDSVMISDIYHILIPFLNHNHQIWLD